jgi:hypothetical protein
MKRLWLLPMWVGIVLAPVAFLVGTLLRQLVFG